MTHDPQGTNKEAELEAWTASRKHSELYGNIPSSFSTAIRALMKGQESEDGPARAQARWQLNRLLRTPSLLSPFYFATKTYHGTRMAGLSTVTPSNLIALYQPVDVAAIFGALYLYRRGRKLSDEKEWALLTADMHARCDLAGCVGFAIPNIGFPLALLAGSMRYLGMAAFMLHDQKGFAEYRRRLKISGKIADLKYETARWGCSHAQVASNLVINLGFSREIAQSVCNGFQMSELKFDRENSGPYAVRCAEEWISALARNPAPPDIVHNGYFYPLKEDLQQLIVSTEPIRQHGSAFSWLEKKAQDLNCKTAPELFSQPLAAEQSQSAPVHDEDALLKDEDVE